MGRARLPRGARATGVFCSWEKHSRLRRGGGCFPGERHSACSAPSAPPGLPPPGRPPGGCLGEHCPSAQGQRPGVLPGLPARGRRPPLCRGGSPPGAPHTGAPAELLSEWEGHAGFPGWPAPGPGPRPLGATICRAQWGPETGPPFPLDFLFCLPVLSHHHARWAALGVLLDPVAAVSASPSTFTVQSAKAAPAPRGWGWARSGLQAVWVLGQAGHTSLRGAGSAGNAGHARRGALPLPATALSIGPCPRAGPKLAGGCKLARCRPRAS